MNKIINDDIKKSDITKVHCDVSNCKYHTKEYYCNAKQIDVGPAFASSSEDTICATFKQK